MVGAAAVCDLLTHLALLLAPHPPPPPPKKYDEQSHVHLQGSVHYLLHTPC